MTRELATALGRCIAAAQDAFDRDYLGVEHQNQDEHWSRCELHELQDDEYRSMLRGSPLVGPEWHQLRQTAIELRSQLPAEMQAAFDFVEALLEPMGVMSTTYESLPYRRATSLPNLREAVDQYNLHDLCIESNWEQVERAWETLETSLDLIEPHGIEPPPPGHLGIRLDRRRGHVHRADAKIELRRDVHWRLLEKLMASRGSYCSRAALETAWESTVSDGSLYTEINRLKTELTPLGISIESERGLGWKLVSTSSTPSG